MLKSVLKANLPLLFILIAVFILTERAVAQAILTGVILSSWFVVSSIWIIQVFWDADDRRFVKVFFGAMTVRFILVLTAFGILIGLTKIDEMYFTVSFIISYLYQSVTEIIFINKILHKRSSEK